MKSRVADQMDRLTIVAISNELQYLVKGVFPKKAETKNDVVGMPHLLWLLKQVEANYDKWPLGKLGRWTGIVMGCMACHGIDVAKIQQIVSKAKIAHGEGIDFDLDCHNNENDPFSFDIGGGD